MKDIHSHLIYGVDDGSKSLEESIELLKKMEKAGTTDLMLTPHYVENSKYVCNNKAKKEIFNKLKERAKKENININLYLGNEVFFTDKFLKLIKNGEIRTLNNSKYLLFEFPMNHLYTIIVTKGDTQTSQVEDPTQENPNSEDPGNTQLQSNNNTAKNISVKGYNIDFSSDKTEYKIKTNDKSLDLDIELEESTATYKVIGNENLSNGSEVKIVVTAENGQEKTYLIKIVDNELSTLQLALAGGIILAIIIVIILIIKSKSKAS